MKSSISADLLDLIAAKPLFILFYFIFFFAEVLSMQSNCILFCEL